ncbi:MAG: flavodoxin [Synergistaceae bacterium]|jgi:flavodoxin|nr:flavodoxin [Synergistaceae bacterium]
MKRGTKGMLISFALTLSTALVAFGTVWGTGGNAFLASAATGTGGQGQRGGNPGNSSGRVLIAYFSMPETTAPNNMSRAEDDSTVVIDGKVLGNTQYVAHLIQENTGGDIFRIEPKTPYPTNHRTLVNLAQKEQSDNARPELAANIPNLDRYDVIFLGYPNWWADMPMILYSFLESVDLSGKTIIPFNTHGGNGFSDTIGTIAKLQPNAAVDKNGFTVFRDDVHKCADDVAAWLRKLGY